MKVNQFSRSLRLALTGAVLTCGATVAFADIKNYEFKLVEPAVKVGPDQTIAVRLGPSSGQLVPGWNGCSPDAPITVAVPFAS